MLVPWRVVVLSPAPSALTTIGEAVNMLHERRLGSPKDGVFREVQTGDIRSSGLIFPGDGIGIS